MSDSRCHQQGYTQERSKLDYDTCLATWMSEMKCMISKRVFPYLSWYYQNSSCVWSATSLASKLMRSLKTSIVQKNHQIHSHHQSKGSKKLIEKGFQLVHISYPFHPTVIPQLNDSMILERLRYYVLGYLTVRKELLIGEMKMSFIAQRALKNSILSLFLRKNTILRVTFFTTIERSNVCVKKIITTFQSITYNNFSFRISRLGQNSSLDCFAIKMAD